MTTTSVMIDESLIKCLKDKHGKYDFNQLIEFMEASNIVFKDRKLKSAAGIATYDCIYVDSSNFNFRIPDFMVYFIILHEMAHHKRLHKYGKHHFIKELSNENYDDLFEHVVGEEILADRYASRVFYKLNNEVFPKYYTQCLDDPNKKAAYRYRIEFFFGKIQNNEEKYDNLFKQFIVEK